MANTQHFTPQLIFLTDGLGALVTALLLSQVLARLDTFIGVPVAILYPLAGLAGILAIYSLTCHFLQPRKWRPWLKTIAIANMCYCLLTLGLMSLAPEITLWGVGYFVGEILVIMVLVKFEFALIRSKGYGSKISTEGVNGG